jgi:hypothetical protein
MRKNWRNWPRADAAARGFFEAMLIGPAGNATVNKDDDALAEAASLYKVDAKALRTAVAKAEKAEKKCKTSNVKEKSAPRT